MSYFLSEVLSSDFFFLFYGLFPDHSSNMLYTYFIFHSCHLPIPLCTFFPIAKLKSPKYEGLVFNIDYPGVLLHMEGTPNIFVEWINLMVESVFSHIPCSEFMNVSPQKSEISLGRKLPQGGILAPAQIAYLLLIGVFKLVLY